MKFVPLTTSVNPGSPACFECGSMDDIVGAGLGVGCTRTVYWFVVVPMPPFLKTMMQCMPGCS